MGSARVEGLIIGAEQELVDKGPGIILQRKNRIEKLSSAASIRAVPEQVVWLL